MQSIAIVAAALAAGIHVWFFAMESVWFMRPGVYGRFGLQSESEASIVRVFAYNQGFYNLFLAVGVIVGLGLLLVGEFEAARVLILFACAVMVAAGVVLYRFNRRGALLQALPSVVAIAGIVVPPLLG
jgi:putative membrane protein